MARTLVGEIIARRNALAVRNQQPPVPYTGAYTGNPMSGLFGSRIEANQEANMAAMGSVGTLFAIVNLTSTAVASLEWKLWRKAKSGDPDDRADVTQHAALAVLRKPNPSYNGDEL